MNLGRTGTRTSMLLLGLVLGWLANAATAVAQEPISADEALQEIGKTSWYDPDTDDYASPKLSGPEQDNRIRNGGWEASVKSRQSKSERQPKSNRGGGGGRLTPGSSNVISIIFLSLLAVALIAVIALLTYHSVRTYMPGRFENKPKSKSIEIDPAKISELPFEAAATQYQNPLEQAEALWRAGRIDEAVLYLYGYQLLALDHARKIELQQGKTNRTYLRELAGQLQLRELLEHTMLMFEDVYFGKHSVDRERFLGSWNRLDEFHRLLTLGRPATAAEVSGGMVEAATT